MRYGQIHDSGMPANIYRVTSLLREIGRIDFGNCGVPTELQEYLKEHSERIEDAFTIRDSMYILPVDRNTAKQLFELCTGSYSEDELGYPESLADEITWVKMGDRYWLSLWWD